MWSERNVDELGGIRWRALIPKTWVFRVVWKFSRHVTRRRNAKAFRAQNFGYSKKDITCRSTAVSNSFTPINDEGSAVQVQ